MKRKLLFVAALVASALGFNANAQTEYKDGDDLTSLIENASFADGFIGWTNNSKGQTPGAVGNFSAFDLPNNVEVYSSTVDVYQVVENVPDGIYSLTLKGFERPTWNGSYTGNEEATVFLYMNDFETPVQNIVTGALPKEEAKDGENCYLTTDKYAESQPAGWNMPDFEVEGHGYVPNGMIGAAIAFNAGRYAQTVYGLVQGGKMTIGITSKGATAHWVLWADFKLTYQGKNAEALTSVIESTIEKYESYKISNAEYINTKEQGVVDAAINAAAEALSAYAENGDELFDALNALNAAYNATVNHVAANVALKTAKDALTTALTTFQETARAEATQKANELLSEDTDNLSTEEINALTGQINYAIAALKIPATVDNATIDNPVDLTSLIVNADIEQGATVGWSSTKKAQNGPNLNNGIHGKSIEFWAGDAATSANDFEFNIWQDLIALPAGTYELSAIAANSLNGLADLGNDGRAYIYAATSVDEDDQIQSLSDPVAVQVEGCLDKNATYSVAFVVKEGEKVTLGAKTVGTMTARWFVADDFTLMYYGTEENLLVEQSDYDALNAAIAEATDKVIGFEDKEYAPYNNIEAIATLSAAQALNQNFTKLKKNVQAVTTSLTEAEWTENDGEVNAVYDGNFAEAPISVNTGDAENDVKGWVVIPGNPLSGLRKVFDSTEENCAQIVNATSGKGLFVWSGTVAYGKTEGYTMPLAAHTIYELNVKYAGWQTGDVKDFTVSVLNEANEGLAAKNLGTANGINTTLASTGKLLFTTGEAGDYTLTVKGTGNFIFTDVTLYKAVDPSVEVAVSEAGYATFSSELPLDLSNIDGGTAYIVADEAEGEYIKLTEQAEAVPANTGLIIAGEGTVTIPVVATANPLEKENYLVAVSKNTTVESGYVLGWDGRDQTTVGFYVVDETPAPVKAGQAYLSFPDSEEEEAAGIKVLRFAFGDEIATAIETAEAADADAEGAIYNVAGQQVGKDYKGIVIKNGKKYLNK